MKKLMLLLMLITSFVHAEEDEEAYIQSIERISSYQYSAVFINNTSSMVGFNCVFYDENKVVTGTDMVFILPPAEKVMLHSGNRPAKSYHCKRIR